MHIVATAAVCPRTTARALAEGEHEEARGCEDYGGSDAPGFDGSKLGEDVVQVEFAARTMQCDEREPENRERQQRAQQTSRS